MNKKKRVKVAVDLTPLRPGGENGGAKTLVATLLQEFSHYRSETFNYLLIAESWNYEELKSYESDNIFCLLKSDLFSVRSSSAEVAQNEAAQNIAEPSKSIKVSSKLKLKLLLKRIFSSLKAILKRLLSRTPRLREKFKSELLIAKSAVGRLTDKLGKVLSKILPKTGILQGRYDVDVLFCPFSAPTFSENGLPLVAIVYDLQHLDLPFFFKENERLHRTNFLQDLLRKATKVVCISEFTRKSFISHLNASSEQLTAIPICIHERLQKRPLEHVNSILEAQGLGDRRYFFFPANFWPHKNHRLLLSAYSIYRQKNSEQPFDLVFTGALEEPQAALKEFVRCLGYEDNVHFLGFLSEDELIAIWQGSQGLIFPSLYEGFGIPLLEAMWFDKPVACSSIGSLPEVGGDSVIYFDPRRPEDVAHGMLQLGNNADLVANLKLKAEERLYSFKKERMTAQYLEVFEDAISPT